MSDVFEPEVLREGKPEKEQARMPGVPDVLPLLPLSDIVVFPLMVAPLMISSERSIRLIDEVVAGNRMLGLILQVDPQIEQPEPDQLHTRGCVGKVLKMLRFPDDTIRVLVQGVVRCEITEVLPREGLPFLRARILPLPDKSDPSVELQALTRNVSNLFQQIAGMSPSMPEELRVAGLNVEEPGRLADLIGANLKFGLGEKQELLAEPNVRRRLQLVNRLLARELEVLQLGSEIQEKVQATLSKTQREYFLREQMRTIQRELGEGSEQEAELEEMRSQVRQAKMSEEAERAAMAQVDRLAIIPPASAEYTVVRNYLDWLIGVPWSKTTVDKLDIRLARAILDEDHHGLESVKDRILEFLAVLKLRIDPPPAPRPHHHAPRGRKRPRHVAARAASPAEAAATPSAGRAPILCFVGPPGVGKTSLGRSISRAMGRNFVRISLGGVRDEAEVRGHRRTYVGALPGRIIQGLRKAGSRNPVFMLDEIDKIGNDYRGDPAAALLEVLDPQQNDTFSDHFLEVPFDLSQVMFITTANQADPIPRPLLDRMELIELPGYIDSEKVQIARRYLLPRQIREHGLRADQLQVDDPTLLRVIHEYTREAGVRNLEREIARVCRRVARRSVERGLQQVTVTPRNLARYLGPARFQGERAERVSVPGVAIGLAWTPVGGDILYVEATRMRGHKGLTMTGSLGEVMRESAQAALSYVRSHAEQYGIDPAFFEQADIHLHVPAGAIPKDGPSAGVTLAVALVSLLTGRLTDPELAMTGEISLSGKVLPVGGVKEKLLAAARHGIKQVIIPRLNATALDEVPEEARSQLKVCLVSDIASAVRLALLPPGQRRRAE